MTSAPLITLFTSPKPFNNPHINVIQRNAIRSWVELGDQVQVVLLGEEEGLAQAARDLNVLHLPQVDRNAKGTPLISSLFREARNVNQSPLLAYVNTDIILFPDFVAGASTLLKQVREFLMVGQRWDMQITKLLDFSAGWQESLRADCRAAGRLHKPMGSDYFVFPRSCFEQIPDFAIGRAGWDNWMIYEARQRGWQTMDATADVMIIHQDHDYSHLPGGQPHYRLPETGENVRLAGGKRHIFLLRDANLILQDGKIARKPLTWKSFWRELEIFPLVKLHSEFLGRLHFAILHPRKAYEEWRKAQKEQPSFQE
jgi:hypothetical protein